MKPEKEKKKTSVRLMYSLTLIYPAHFEDVPCQSGVNHIFEGKNDYVSRQVIYHCKEECLSFIKKQTEIQIYKFYASYAHEIDVKRWICHRSKRNEIQGAGKLGLTISSNFFLSLKSKSLLHDLDVADWSDHAVKCNLWDVRQWVSSIRRQTSFMCSYDLPGSSWTSRRFPVPSPARCPC